MSEDNKTVVIYGATVPEGSALVHELGRAHALIYIADLRFRDANALAQAVVAAGGYADASEVDLLNIDAVREFTAEVAAWNSGIDVAVVAIRPEYKAVQLPIARIAANFLVSDHAQIMMTIAEPDAASGDFDQFRAAAVDAGVSVVTILTVP